MQAKPSFFAGAPHPLDPPTIWAHTFFQEGTFSNLSDYANQLGEEPCNCHAYNIRLAKNPNEYVLSQKSRTVILSQKIRVFGENAETPCGFREASYAWDVLGDETEFADSTVLSMDANKQGIVSAPRGIRPTAFDPPRRFTL